MSIEYNTNLLESITDRNFIWFGVLSYEERSLASLEYLIDHNRNVVDIFVLDYSKNAMPFGEAKEKRETNKNKLKNLVPTARFDECLFPLDPYNGWGVGRALEAAHQRSQSDSSTLILDITCLTKIHAIIIAAELSCLDESRILTCYTIPHNYVGLAEQKPNFKGFSMPIIAPIVRGATLKNETRAIGIIVAGHESQRLVLAYDEFEAEDGVIVLATAENRPDIRLVTEERNHRLISELTEQRGWKKRVIKYGAVEPQAALTFSIIEQARARRAPIILYPFGPKTIVLTMAGILADEYSDGSWFVYPIPSSYDANYTEGSSRTAWLSWSSIRRQRQLPLR